MKDVWNEDKIVMRDERKVKNRGKDFYFDMNDFITVFAISVFDFVFVQGGFVCLGILEVFFRCSFRYRRDKSCRG